MQAFEITKQFVQAAKIPSNYAQAKDVLVEIEAAYAKLERRSMEKLIIAFEEAAANQVLILETNLSHWQRSVNKHQLFEIRAEIYRLKAIVAKKSIRPEQGE